ncbi:hypothetical protein Z043_110508 [Scleropages formosus]|uniref:trypsin n=1 Tax=Scleropages formosus TaxID=113540 RepID=A0A0P7YSL7_SCLFO|nr:hypothetical protein Z043_110508 [Scleropages formosus]
MEKNHKRKRNNGIVPPSDSNAGLGLKAASNNSANCYTGNGQDYRGTVAVTESGQMCLKWDLYGRAVWNHGLSSGLGKHNYCRNPDSSRKPWCYTRVKNSVKRKFCNIPRCPSQPKPPTTCGERTKKQLKIVGGRMTTVESQPWIASIFMKSRSRNVFQCGGSLISPCWVLTAAHCFPEGSYTDSAKYTVFLGKNAINETDPTREQSFIVEEVIIHEAYEESGQAYNNDIALLKIRGNQGQCAYETDTVRTVCLPPRGQMLPSGTYCQIAGYGKTEEGFGFFSQFLKETSIQLMSQSICTEKEYYGNMMTENMFCAGSPEWDTDSCKGDSGGPLICEVNDHMFLFGIVSWGEGCSRKFRPGVYTRVTNYNQWIEDKTHMPDIASGSMYPVK